jgi:hypothetical protein
LIPFKNIYILTSLEEGEGDIQTGVPCDPFKKHVYLLTGLAAGEGDIEHDDVQPAVCTTVTVPFDPFKNLTSLEEGEGDIQTGVPCDPLKKHMYLLTGLVACEGDIAHDDVQPTVCTAVLVAARSIPGIMCTVHKRSISTKVNLKMRLNILKLSNINFTWTIA